MIKRYHKYLILILLMSPLSTFAKTNDQCVILLHGLARTHNSMNDMQKALVNSGYEVINDDYPSRKYSVEVLSNKYIPPMLEQCHGARHIHFVTHSMGGILIRYYLSNNAISNLGRIVMLSPPNQGSEAVDKLKWFPPFHWINGPAANQLGTDSNSVPLNLPDADFELGIIAGNTSINWILSLLIPGADDGKVSVTNAQLTGSSDFIVLPHSHPFIMKRPLVIQNTLSFLKNACFLTK